MISDIVSFFSLALAGVNGLGLSLILLTLLIISFIRNEDKTKAKIKKSKITGYVFNISMIILQIGFAILVGLKVVSVLT